jgi:hypothetical protein
MLWLFPSEGQIVQWTAWTDNRRILDGHFLLAVEVGV